MNTTRQAPAAGAARGTPFPLEIVDLSHPLSIHTPGWVGYPGLKLYYTQNLQTHRIVSQRLETSLHVGTHIDSPLHGVKGGKDVSSLSLDRLVREGVIVDISDAVDDWDEIKPAHITDRIEVRRGDIVLYHTGYAKYYQGGSEEDLERYMCMHPGGGRELAEWIVEMELAWTGSDTGSGDHPMNTTIRDMRADLAGRYARKRSRDLESLWPEEDLFVMHRVPFAAGIVHAENVGGAIGRLGTRRCQIGAFPLNFSGAEASICRIVAFLEPHDE